MLLEAALRTAHAVDPVDDADKRVKALVRGLPSRAERIEKLVAALRETLRARRAREANTAAAALHSYAPP